MRRLFFILLLILCHFSAGAQTGSFVKNLYASLQIVWDTSTQSWKDTISHTSYQWNPDGSFKEFSTINSSPYPYYNHVTFSDFKAVKETILFDIGSSGDLIRSWYNYIPSVIKGALPLVAEYSSEDSTGILHPLKKNLYTYDSDGRLKEIITQFYKNNQWINENKITTLFDAKGSYAGYSSFYYDNGTWIQARGLKFACSYNSAGFINQVMQYSWSSGTWREVGKEIYKLASDGSVKEVGNFFTFGHNDWEPVFFCKNIDWHTFAPKLLTVSSLFNGSYFYLGTPMYNSFNVYSDSTSTIPDATVSKKYANDQPTYAFENDRGQITETYWDYYASGKLKMQKNRTKVNNTWRLNDSTMYSFVYDSDNDPTEIITENLHWNGTRHAINSYKDVFFYNQQSSITQTAPVSTLIQLYPNPCGTSLLHLSFDESLLTDVKSIMVIDICGRVQLQEKNFRQDKTTIDVSGLQPGSYFVILNGNKANGHYPFIKI